MEVITTHINADFDAMGSMIAAKKLYPNAVLVFPGSQERTLREFFVTSTVYIYNFKRLRDLDIQKVTRLIIVDTRQLSRIGKFEEIIGRPGLEIHLYDHHPDTDEDIEAQLSIVKPLGSTVTLLTQLIRERGLDISPEEATIMSLGLFEDTGSFTFNSTTPDDFEVAAHLLRCGADLNVVSDMVTQELTAEQVALLNELIQSARTYDIQGIEVCIATVSVEKYVGDFAILVHKLKDIESLDVVFALAQMDDRIYLVGRSRLPEINVGTIASYFGGGGHATAAAASIKDMTLIQTEDKLLELLRSMVRPYPTAEALMSSPVITAEPGMSINDAAQLMVRYSINATPVVDGETIVGIISRQVLEKAVFHGLEALTVGEFMNPDFTVVLPDATLIDIQTHLVEQHQRILPVVKDRKLVGVITRRDLLKFLVEDRSMTPKSLVDDTVQSHWTKRKNVSSIVMEQLPKPVIERLREFGKLADRMNYRVYAVGGFVRDLLLRRPNLDIDIVVEGDGIAFARTFAAEHGTRARSHKKFNTAVLIFPGDQRVDVASARFEYYQYPAALPVVEFGSLKMDLYRRDFTINTLALGLNTDNFGQLIDFFGAQRDLKERIIRVLHSLSFVEDPTRVLRAIRFEQRFGFRIGKQTAALIRNSVKMGLMQKLGGRRLYNEIQHILNEDNPSPALRRLADFEVVTALSPELRFDNRMEQLLGGLKEAITWYRLSFLDEPLEGWYVYLLGLLSGLKKVELEGICGRLQLPENQRDRILWTYENFGELLRSFFQLPDIQPSDIYRAFQPFRPEELLFIMGRAESEEKRKMVSHYFYRYRHATTEIKGKDLKALGIPPGPIYRKLLDEILDARLNGSVKNRAQELEYLHLHHPDLVKESDINPCAA